MTKWPSESEHRPSAAVFFLPEMLRTPNRTKRKPSSSSMGDSRNSSPMTQTMGRFLDRFGRRGRSRRSRPKIIRSDNVSLYNTGLIVSLSSRGMGFGTDQGKDEIPTCLIFMSKGSQLNWSTLGVNADRFVTNLAITLCTRPNYITRPWTIWLAVIGRFLRIPATN